MKPASLPGPPARHAVVLVVVALVLATVSAYWRVGQATFLNLDDDAYVQFQPLVNQGIRPAALVWAFTAVHSSNWHPLTSISHMIDCDLFGLQPGPMHWENLCWHVLNSLLVFLVWRRLTGCFWRPALVAALFALHPLHVESVAWIAERKDVLSTFFWLLGLVAYVVYVRRPAPLRYGAVVGALFLALLAKPMAVTFPCTLLLLDFWPLRRWPERSWRWLLREKRPLFGLVGLHSIVTFLVQHATGAAQYGERFGWSARCGNAVVSYWRYLGKTFWPEALAPLYRHPGSWPAGCVGLSVLGLASVTYLAWSQRRRLPWLTFGWLWFLGTLVPVIGLIQVGAQSMADRYTYVPLLGIFTIIAWSAATFAARPFERQLAGAAAAGFLGACFVFTRRQVPAWRDSASLYEHSIAVGEDGAAIRYLLASAYQSAQRPEAAVQAQYDRALSLEPTYINALSQLAILALRHDDLARARKLIEQTVQLEPDNPGVHGNLGAFCFDHGQLDEAEVHYRAALRLNPRDAGVHLQLGRLFMRLHRPSEALEQFRAAAAESPWDAAILNEAGANFFNQGQRAAAEPYFERALWIVPGFAQARENLRVTRESLGAGSSGGSRPPP